MAISKRGLAAGGGAIRRLAAEAQQRVGEAFAAFIREELRAQHIRGRSIYGKRYPQPQKGNAPMLDTGLLMDGYDVTVLDGGRRIRVGQHVYYSRFLDNDGEHEHLPRQTLPAKWQTRLEKIKKTETQRFWREVKAALGLRGKVGS